MYLANDASNLITNVTINKFIVKSLKSNPDYASSSSIILLYQHYIHTGVNMPNMPLLQKVKVEDKNDGDQQMDEKEHNTETLVVDQAEDRP